MITNNGIMKHIAKLGWLLMMGVSMSACAGLIDHTMSWKEEVLLHDGQIIVAKRFYNLGGYPGIESRERGALDEMITFSLPGKSKEITWKTDFRDSEPEPNSLNLIRFDVVKGMPYIATYPAGCIAYNKWGRPNPPQVLFKYENDQWQRINLTEFPVELLNAQANVVVGRPKTSLLKSFYTVEGVNEENHEIDTPQYRTILREVLPSAGNSCPKMVPYGKGGWLGLDWFSDQPTYEACLKFCDKKGVNPQSCPCENLFKEKK